MSICLECFRVVCQCPGSIRTSETLIDPEPGIRTHAAELRMRLLRYVLDNDTWDRLIDLGVERATSVGAREYGNASYAKTNAQLQDEGDAELADWIFYQHIPLERADG